MSDRVPHDRLGDIRIVEVRGIDGGKDTYYLEPDNELSESADKLCFDSVAYDDVIVNKKDAVSIAQRKAIKTDYTKYMRRHSFANSR